MTKPFVEADMIVGGVALTLGQSLAVRVAIGHFLDQLGDEEIRQGLGSELANAYKARLSEVLIAMHTNIEKKEKPACDCCVQSREAEKVFSDYDGVTPLEWAEYEFATIEYDHRISPDAAKAIRAIFKRLYDGARPMSLADSDKAAAAVSTGAPRVTLDQIKAAIDAEYIFTAEKAIDAMSERDPMPYVQGGPLSILTICILVMSNGFTIIGKSAPASPENFNAEYGANAARDDAMRQAWGFMGFSLRDRLAANG